MIIGISGKIGSGKDTVGKIINYLVTGAENQYENIEGFLEYYNDGLELYPYKIKKFADTLKDIVCLLLGCTREQLEDREFKEKELGEEWWFYGFGDLEKENYIIKIPYLEANNKEENKEYLIKLTPRKLLQLLGTDCGRDIIHPNIWCNSLFNKYIQKDKYYHAFTDSLGINNGLNLLEYPKWIITDLRFPNELKAIEDRNGITIRVNRNYNKENLTLNILENVISNIMYEEHESETALDNSNFKYTINNDGTIEELIEKVKEILIKENIIN